MKTLTWIALSAFVMTGIIGCACPPPNPKPIPVAKAAPAPVAKPAAKAAPAAMTGACGDYVVSQTYLTSGVIRLDKAMPSTVRRGTTFEYTITVTNLTDMAVSEVQVRDRLPDSYKYAGSTPPAKQDGNLLTWTMDSLGPKAVEKIVVKGVAAQAGCLQTCADVTFVIPMCASTQVVEPMLAISKVAPSEVTICDPIPLKFTVTNKGTGTAENVKLMDTLPEGLTTQDDKKSIEMALGSLNAGQSATRTVIVKADKSGTFKNQATAVADGDLKALSEQTTTLVTQPVLAIEKSGPKKEYLGRSIKYDITVTNKGNAVAADTVITDTIPENVSNPQATPGGVLADNRVTWKIGDLAPKASKTVSVSYVPAKDGMFSNTARATAVCAEGVSASVDTQINAISAILLEVVDASDPIEVGKDVTYVITVTNQGSAPATGVSIKAMLEDTMQYVSSSGATAGTIDGSTITFAKLPSLAPKAKASWRVVVKAVKPGDVRFKVTMNSDQLTRDVEETEATNFYE